MEFHLTESTLRAYLDDELDPNERARARAHLDTCADCRARLTALEMQSARVNARLTALTPRANEMPRSAQTVYAQFNARRDSASRKENVIMFKSIFTKRSASLRRLRPVWIALASLAIILVALSFQPVRAWAGQFLGLFRAQEVTVLPIDPTTFSQLSGNTALGKQIEQVLAASMTVTKKPNQPQVVNSATDASQLAGFAVRLPTNRTDTPRLTVQDSQAFQFLIDRARAQAVINEAGRNDLQLPASVDGATINVSIPAGVTAAYGSDCPITEEDAQNAIKQDKQSAHTSGSPGRRFINCVLLAEIPSPTVDTPPNLDVQQLAELGLQFTGMSAAQAHEYAQTVDWTSTLVVPIPRNGASYQKVNVDGVTGYMIQRPLDDAPEYTLIWVKGGIVFAIGGLGNGTTSALEMANSLK